MDRQTFAAHLERASTAVLPFTRKFVTNPLPDAVAYLVHTNQSNDDVPVGHEEFYPDEEMDREPVPRNAEEVVQFLYRSGKVPEWINVTVERTDERWTYLRLDCCGRFTAQEDQLYHQATGHPPFLCHSPAFPSSWRDDFSDRRFDLYWQERECRGCWQRVRRLLPARWRLRGEVIG